MTTTATRVRRYPDPTKWRLRFGATADCIGLSQTCRRPDDSDDVEACVGCPYLVNRESGMMDVTPHAEGVI
jgi:hypothetical protein